MGLLSRDNDIVISLGFLDEDQLITLIYFLESIGDTDQCNKAKAYLNK